ncbi:MAG: FmdB family zinc ribbon protein [Elusimicrobiota bacterium]
MPINTYRCPECEFKKEYIESFSTSKDQWHPEVCPECGKGKLEKVFDYENSHGGFDIIGYCYANTLGKKNWKKHLSKEDQIKVLKDNKNPY